MCSPSRTKRHAIDRLNFTPNMPLWPALKMAEKVTSIPVIGVGGGGGGELEPELVAGVLMSPNVDSAQRHIGAEHVSREDMLRQRRHKRRQYSRATDAEEDGADAADARVLAGPKGGLIGQRLREGLKGRRSSMPHRSFEKEGGTLHDMDKSYKHLVKEMERSA